MTEIQDQVQFDIEVERVVNLLHADAARLFRALGGDERTDALVLSLPDWRAAARLAPLAVLTSFSTTSAIARLSRTRPEGTFVTVVLVEQDDDAFSLLLTTLDGQAVEHEECDQGVLKMPMLGMEN